MCLDFWNIANGHGDKTLSVGSTIDRIVNLKHASPRQTIPRPLPDFSLRLQDKIWEWPGDEAKTTVHDYFTQ